MARVLWKGMFMEINLSEEERNEKMKALKFGKHAFQSQELES